MDINIKDAAKFAHVARSTIYAKIASGELSKTPNWKLDPSEVMRVFGNPTERDPLQKQAQLDAIRKTLELEKNHEVTLLKERVKLLEQTLEDYKTREAWLTGKIDTLTDTMKVLEPSKEEKEKKSFFSRLFS